MYPVMQTKFGKDGNCFSACVASILEVSLAKVPSDPGTGRRVWRDYLAQFGLGMLTVNIGSGWPPEEAWCVAGGQSPRGLPHAVVWRFLRDGAGQMAHDPHPNGDGLVGVPKDLTFFVALRPSGAPPAEAAKKCACGEPATHGDYCKDVEGVALDAVNEVAIRMGIRKPSTPAFCGDSICSDHQGRCDKCQPSTPSAEKGEGK